MSRTATEFMRLRGLYGNSREEYLQFVIESGVATDAERGEYRDSYRKEVLALWESHSAAIEADRARAEKADRAQIAFHSQQAMRLRQLGEYDLAVKREEYVLFLERTVGQGVLASSFSYRSLPGWGDEALRSAGATAA